MLASDKKNSLDNTLVWELMLQLTSKELKSFSLFIASPYFNRRDDLQQLHAHLNKARRKNKPALKKRELFFSLFPNQEYNDQKLRLLISDFLKLLEQFLTIQEWENDSLGQPHLLLSAYRRRKLSRHFQTTMKQAEKKLLKQPLRHPDFFWENFLIEQERYSFLSSEGRTQELNLQTMDNQLTTTMVTMKLRQICLMRSHETVFNTQYEIAMLQEVLQIAQSPPMQKVLAIRLYLLCYQALFSEQTSDDKFLSFKSLLFESTDAIPKPELRGLYLLAINFCIKKINENVNQYYREAHELYKSGLASELLVENGKMSRFTYNNIVGLSIRIPDIWNWVEWFVKEYKDFLEPEYREPFFNLSSARLEFARKNYDAALHHLQQADYRDLINNLVVKTLQLKIYYEINEFDLLESHLRTMAMFIRRNKKLGYHRENWSNIVNYTRKLMDLNPFDKSAKQILRKEIEATEILTEKQWLLSQLN